MTHLTISPSLEQVLAARDSRVARHLDILRHKTPQDTLLSLTIVTPGPEKRNRRELIIAHAACLAILSRFSDRISFCDQYDLSTGFEADILVNIPIDKAKRIAVQIEESHPLGRLFDIDIIGDNGIPLSRSDLGLLPGNVYYATTPRDFV